MRVDLDYMVELEAKLTAAQERSSELEKQIAALEQEVWRLQSKLSEVFDYDARDTAK